MEEQGSIEQEVAKFIEFIKLAQPSTYQIPERIRRRERSPIQRRSPRRSASPRRNPRPQRSPRRSTSPRPQRSPRRSSRRSTSHRSMSPSFSSRRAISTICFQTAAYFRQPLYYKCQHVYCNQFNTDVAYTPRINQNVINACDSCKHHWVRSPTYKIDSSYSRNVILVCQTRSCFNKVDYDITSSGILLQKMCKLHKTSRDLKHTIPVLPDTTNFLGYFNRYMCQNLYCDKYGADPLNFDGIFKLCLNCSCHMLASLRRYTLPEHSCEVAFCKFAKLVMVERIDERSCMVTIYKKCNMHTVLTSDTPSVPAVPHVPFN